jgi:hypothetical protein
MIGITLEFSQHGDFDSFDIIRSSTSMHGLGNDELPNPIVTGLPTMYYVDTAITEGATYYYKCRVWLGNEFLLSDEISIRAKTINDDYAGYVQLYMPLQSDFSQVVGGKTVTAAGTNNSFQTAGGIVGDGFYRAGGASYIDFDMTGFFSGKTPFCIEFYARSNGSGTDGVVSFAATKSVDYALATLTSESWFISRDNNSWAHLFLNTGAIRNTWNHYALTYDGESLRRFLNGNLVGITTETIGFTQSRNLGILGKKSNDLNHPSANDFQHLRLTKGVPRYIDSFAPPVVFNY